MLFLVELDETMLDGLGILPQRKQHKKLLLVSFDYFCLLLSYLKYSLFLTYDCFLLVHHLNENILL